jgi:superfamily I DNA/RNA helicase
MDDAFGRLKLDLRLAPDALARIAREATGPERRTTRAKRNAPSPTDLRTVGAFLAYQASLRDRGALDFDDLVVRALELLIREAEPLRLWRRRCAHLLVDEVQDLDRSQLDLAVLLAGEERRIFLVGDDDQTIYAWRLADVRRVIGLAAQLPGLRRFDLTVNYRCPRPVVERAVRLVAHNRERFRKRIAPRAGATGSLRLAPLPTDDVTRARRILGRWRQEGLAADAGARWAVLARTNTELAPYGAVALELGIPFSAEEHGLLLDVPSVDERLGAAEAAAGLEADPLVAMARLHQRDAAASALLAWAAPYPTIGALRTAIAAARQRLTMLHRDNAALVLATVHGTKGLEFDHVAVVGLDEGRFPSRRSLEESEDPKRALEEERRLAYVAWTRAKRSLTLVYDPGAPSRFLREAFGEQELSPGSGSSAGRVS